MYVTVNTYRAKVGEEDAIIALHEDWQRNHGLRARDYLSWELLRKVEAPREFIVIAHFASEELAKTSENELEQDAWYCRLLSLIEGGQVRIDCTSEWQFE